MPLIDFDDIQAEENRRREVAVKAGASATQTKYEDSPLKQMIKDYVEEATPAVADKFGEHVQNTVLPGYNFAPSAFTNPSAEEIKANADKLRADSLREQKLQAQLQKEAKENELKVTSTSTGLPKVDKSGNVVEPLQSEGESNIDPSALKSTETTNPSPIGSGDAKAAAASTDGKSDNKGAESQKK